MCDELLSFENLKILDTKQKFIEFSYDGNPLNLKTLESYKPGYLGQTPTIVFGWVCKK